MKHDRCMVGTIFDLVIKCRHAQLVCQCWIRRSVVFLIQTSSDQMRISFFSIFLEKASQFKETRLAIPLLRGKVDILAKYQ
jgi:hypothetical protein